ncbi:citrate synthase family protein [Cellvibrio japonicus]|uniref:citrate/2-methylcitrate synthase n=1 Tax=Cellvibrio japonicus TaxID=155077 RepID=UPI00031BA932|nr:citrate/2-methylcitrate synthase [Cellvibrio japonicus]QEI11412.1 citrate synthase [Cellvibrio japonicus]QEI14986.1 citrate synthase [Cellvibrio japonicus]QEI18566.1 citrate synthase [Cellvibrio japonicus]
MATKEESVLGGELPQASPDHGKVEHRNQVFEERVATRIWGEVPCQDNPYIATKVLCHGYDLLELMNKRSFVDVFYLLFRGELPGAEQAQLLEQLMIGLINPGPRHPAVRAAMNAGVGKTNPVHILPIALGIFGGVQRGAGAIEQTMRYLRKSVRTSPADAAAELIKAGETHLSQDNLTALILPSAPGFGRVYGSPDTLMATVASQLLVLPASGPCLHWAHDWLDILADEGIGWLSVGLAAAVFCDLGFQPRYGSVLFQLLAAPGLAAHGLELANKPITAMPFVKDENYVIEP